MCSATFRSGEFAKYQQEAAVKEPCDRHPEVRFITDPYQRRIVHGNLIGKQGQGFEIAMCNLNDYRFNINNSSLNAAQARIHNPGEHLKVRKQCDKSLDQFQI
ncbi:unnamed protein product [Rotaria sordida]|uniref:Uncharacterized protein n=1 Tax=Rotaria sordida TaxID=392033 RepID=A0A814YGM4_9BILA|nr:unnamed protein product [Rotaria sordida]